MSLTVSAMPVKRAHPQAGLPPFPEAVRWGEATLWFPREDRTEPNTQHRAFRKTDWDQDPRFPRTIALRNYDRDKRFYRALTKAGADFQDPRCPGVWLLDVSPDNALAVAVLLESANARVGVSAWQIVLDQYGRQRALAEETRDKRFAPEVPA